MDLTTDDGQSNRDFFPGRYTKTPRNGNVRGPVRRGHADKFFAMHLGKML